MVEHEERVDPGLELLGAALELLEIVGADDVDEFERQLPVAVQALQLPDIGARGNRIAGEDGEGLRFRHEFFQQFEALAVVSRLPDAGDVVTGTVHAIDQAVL